MVMNCGATSWLTVGLGPTYFVVSGAGAALTTVSSFSGTSSGERRCELWTTGESTIQVQGEKQQKHNITIT